MTIKKNRPNRSLNAFLLGGWMIFISQGTIAGTAIVPSQPEITVLAQAIQVCPRQFSGWTLVESFLTETYSLALCQQGEDLVLVGHYRGQHEAFVEAVVTELSDRSLVAMDDYGFTYSLAEERLTIRRAGQVIGQERLLESSNGPEP